MIIQPAKGNVSNVVVVTRAKVRADRDPSKLPPKPRKPAKAPRKPREAAPYKGAYQNERLYGFTVVDHTEPGKFVAGDVVGEYSPGNYANGAHSPIRFIPAKEVKIAIAGKIADNYRSLRVKPPEATIQPPAKIDNVFRPMSCREKKHARKMTKPPIHIPADPAFIRTHGRNAVMAVAETEARLIEQSVLTLGTVGLNAHSIRGKRLVREGDGGKELARGILPSQWGAYVRGTPGY